MKALSIKHPWMQWTLEGVERAERRPWNTHYRGPVLLCSSKELDTAAATEDDETRGWRYGMALAVAELVEVRPMRDEDTALTCCALQQGAFVFIWGKVTPLQEPFEVRGLPGLFDVDHESLRWQRSDATFVPADGRVGGTEAVACPFTTRPPAAFGAAAARMSPVIRADFTTENRRAL